MKPSPPVPGGAPGMRHQPAADIRGAASGRRPDYHLTLDYYTVMKPQRTYPLSVTVPPGTPLAPDLPTSEPVMVRPIIPGALVVPSQQALDLACPGARVQFQVTPVARGRLSGSHIEILRDGHVVQELPLGMRARTQGPTLFLFLLTLILPPLVMHYTGNSGVPEGLVRGKRLKKEAIERLQRGEKVKGINDAPPPELVPPPPPAPPGNRAPGNVQRMPRAGEPPAAALFFHPVFFGEIDQGKEDKKEEEKEPQKERPGGRGMRGGGAPPGPPPLPPPPKPEEMDPFEDYKYAGQPGDVLEDRLNEYLNVRSQFPEELGIQRAVLATTWGIGRAYQFVCGNAAVIRPGLLTFLVLAGMTFCSLVARRTQRHRRSCGLSLPPPLGTIRPSDSAETLPLAPGPSDRTEAGGE